MGQLSKEITVFYWQGSPWASKVVNYLNLRGIPFTECHQPITMPRPDLEALGVNYRRIPLVSIGRDVYCDTLLILSKLESLFPSAGNRGPLGAQKPEQKALEKLLEKWTDLAVFPKAADCIPLDHPLVQDPKFIEDRSELWGEKWDRATREKKRPDGLVNMRLFFEFLEDTLLADGRKWVLGTDDVMLADIHSAWIFNWMLSLEGSFPEELVSQQKYPKTLAWCERYNKACEDATAADPKAEVIDGDEVLKRVAKAEYGECEGNVDILDPLKLKRGQKVLVSPTDTGFTAKDEGELVALTAREVVIGKKTKDGTDIRVHAPRWNFLIKAA